MVCWLALVAILLGASAAASPPPQASFDAEFRRGLVALENNHPAEARQSLERASQLQPQNPKVWVALAQACLRSNQVEPAHAAAQRAETLAAGDPIIQHSLAIFYSETGDFARAAGLERRFAASQAADPQAAARAAVLSMQAGEPREAIPWAKAALGKEDRAGLHHLLGQAFEATQQPDAALVELRKAAGLAPGEEAFTFDLGQVLLHRGDFAGALAELDPARQRFPKSAQIQLAYGVAAYGQRRFRDAIASFLEAARLDPSMEQPYVFLGKILDQAGDLMPEVLACYSAWEKAAPNNYLPWFLHAKALVAASGDPAESEARLRQSIHLNGGFWESHLELGVLLMKRRQWQEAASEFSRSVELNAKNPVAHFQLARAYDRLGKSEQARAERAEHERLSAAEISAEHTAGAKSAPQESPVP